MAAATSGGSGSTVEEEVVVVGVEGSDESCLELGLGLSLGVVGLNTNTNTNNSNSKHVPRILTAKDLPSSSASSCSSLGLRTLNSSLSPNNSSNNNKSHNLDNGKSSVGTKRAASPTGASQVVGWPPIRAYRMNSMANQAKSIATGEHSAKFDEPKQKEVVFGTDSKGKMTPQGRVPVRSSLFVKVNMDGIAIGRKVDLNAHPGYESLARTLEEMFIDSAAEKSNGNELMLMPKLTRPSLLLDGSSDYVLTYEDKDGDLMLVGDVPWGMFLCTVKRLRIMRTSEASRLEERGIKQRSRPI